MRGILEEKQERVPGLLGKSERAREEEEMAGPVVQGLVAFTLSEMGD